ncbi:MAG: hypothetical protein IMF26_10705 [Candidatus Fermentithermobacillus carboniphilus]|uniref:Uncharacterized protein n=1 Tax=Candidatus Fermentithermobacillus carboniphilus TaxID=3085328 RepID=A0AAT9LBK5_9FIRM|nr:MAG: hypothetical protein IMF26_10705 [Candidatus Fermentithermobacillus carboniphilus]
MHLAGIISAIIVGIYTLSWAFTLFRDGNLAGAFWSFVLAVTSTAVTLYYFYQHGFYP